MCNLLGILQYHLYSTYRGLWGLVVVLWLQFGDRALVCVPGVPGLNPIASFSLSSCSLHNIKTCLISKRHGTECYTIAKFPVPSHTYTAESSFFSLRLLPILKHLWNSWREANCKVPCSWYWPKHILCSGWLSRLLFQGDVVHDGSCMSITRYRTLWGEAWAGLSGT